MGGAVGAVEFILIRARGRFAARLLLRNARHRSRYRVFFIAVAWLTTIAIKSGHGQSPRPLKIRIADDAANASRHTRDIPTMENGH